MNRICVLILVLSMLFGIQVYRPAPAKANSSPLFFRDNISCPNIQTINRYDRLFAQARAIADCLGVITEWDDDTKMARFWGQIGGNRFADLRFYPLFNMTAVHMYNSDGSYLGQANFTYVPIVIDGRTYLPFRDLVEAFGVRVDWIPTGSSGRPEVRINTDLWPLPSGMGAAYRSHIRSENGHFTLFQPEGGWPTPPAGYIGMVRALDAVNRMIDHYRAKEPSWAYTLNEGAGPRGEFLVGRNRVDHYGTHAVVWMRSEVEAREYIDGLIPNNWWTRLRSTLFGGVIGGLGELLGSVPWMMLSVVNRFRTSVLIKTSTT